MARHPESKFARGIGGTSWCVNSEVCLAKLVLYPEPAPLLVQSLFEQRLPPLLHEATNW